MFDNNNNINLEDNSLQGFEDVFEDVFEFTDDIDNEPLINNSLNTDFDYIDDAYSSIDEMDSIDTEFNDSYIPVDEIEIDPKFQLEFDDSIDYDDLDDFDSYNVEIDSDFENIPETQTSLRNDKRLIELNKYRNDKNKNTLNETFIDLATRTSKFAQLFNKYAHKDSNKINTNLLNEVRSNKLNLLNISITDKYFYLIEDYVSKIVYIFDLYVDNIKTDNVVDSFMNYPFPELFNGENRTIASLAEGNRDAYNYIAGFVRDLYELKLKLVDNSITKSNESFNVYEYYLNKLLKDFSDTVHIIKQVYNSNKDNYTDNLVFVDSVDVKTNKYTCGHCKERVDADRPFYFFALVPVNVNSNEIYNLIPGVNICPNCKYINTLSKMELDSIESKGKLEKESIVYLRGSFKEQRPHGICYTERELSSKDLEEAVPNCFEFSEGSDFDATKEQIKLLNWRSGIESYKNLLEYLRYEDVNLADKTDEELPVDEEQTIQYVAKIMCSVLNLNYSEYYNKATDSCIKHLSDSSLSGSLSYSTMATIEMADKNKNLIDNLKDMNDDDFHRNVLSLYYSYGYTDFNKVDSEPRYIIIDRLNKLHDNFISRISVAKQKQEDYLNQLDKYFFELGSIPITNDKINSYTRLNFMYNDRLMHIISKIANSMIIFNLAEDFFKVWFVGFKRVGKSRNNLKNAHFNKINDFSGDPYEFYDILFKAIKDIDDAYGKYLQKSENVELYIIPDFEVLELLDDLIKLKIDIISDEYKTFIILDKILTDKYYKSQDLLNNHLSKLETLENDIHSLVEYYGKSSKSRLYYYFNNIFSKEEIDNDYEIYMDSIQINNILPRLENETFKEYMDRMNNFKIGDCECIDNSNELAYKLSEYFVDIECVISLALHITDQSNDRLYRIITFISIILSLKKFYNYKEVIEMLGYSNEVINYLMMDSDTSEYSTNNYDLDFFEQAIKLSSIIYNDEEFNESLSNCGVDATMIQKTFKENEDNIELFCKYYNEDLARVIYEFIDS